MMHRRASGRPEKKLLRRPPMNGPRGSRVLCNAPVLEFQSLIMSFLNTEASSWPFGENATVATLE
jgi:hypothetical protein